MIGQVASDRGLRTVTLWLLAVFLSLVGVLLVVVGPSTGFTLDFFVGFGLSMILVVLAGWLTLLVPQNPVAWVLLLSIMSAVSASLASDYLASASEQVPLLARVAFFIQSGVFWVGIYLMTVLFLLLFPTGKPPTPKWRWVGILGFIGLLTQIARATYLAWTLPLDQLEDGATGVSWFDAAITLGQGLVALAVVGALVSFVYRFFRSEGVERQQLKALLIPFTALALFWIVESIRQDTVVSAVLLVVAALTLPMAIGVAILRYRLYNIDRIISRVVAYSIVVVSLGALYFGLVAVASQMLPSQNALAVAGSTLVVARAFNPWRRRVQRRIDQRFNRSAYKADIVSERFAGHLRSPHTTDELTHLWLETVNEHFQPTSGGVWISDAFHDRRAEEAEVARHSADPGP